jgi:coatomer subunit beta'
MDIPVAFRLLPSSQTLAAHYFWPRSGVVPPKCRYYTLAVIMRPQRNPTFGNDGFFTLESTKARAVLGLRSDNDPEEIFKRATERGFKVHEVKLAFVCARTEVS